MENAVRSAEYLSQRQTRLDELRATLADTLAAHPRVTLEIGCGHGHFLTAYAAAHPQTFCVGVDLVIDRVVRAARKRDRAALPNLAFIRAEALEFLSVLPAHVRFADVFILFPDPWPKRRHHKNRIIQPELLTTLATLAEPAARLCFRTDYAPYFDEARATISAHPDWQTDPAAPWPFELVTVFQSRAASYQSLVALRKQAAAPATRVRETLCKSCS